MKALHWLNALIGIWFIIAPWALSFSGHSGALWASIIVGAIQLIVSFWAAVTEDPVGWGLWQGWIALLAGIWFLIQPYVLSGLGTSEQWVSTILGIITIIFSLIVMGKKKSS